MRHEHHQIAAIAARIEHDRAVIEDPMTHDRSCALRADLVGLVTLLRAHIEREELFLLPVLASATTH
jgi:hemerythrin-like domain-containing protein